MSLSLSPAEQAMLRGDDGPGVALAMRLVTQLAEAMGAADLLPITGAHIDSCLYHGQSGLDFVNALVDGGALVQVPSTLNVSSLDLLHPELIKADTQTADEARALMDGYVALGCEPTWTCAPYQSEVRPAFGEHIAWAESNAIVFANSVLGARTARYGDFIDIAAAITSRVPNAGLHLTAKRAATLVVDVSELSAALLSSDAAYPVIGLLVGRISTTDVPVIVGLPRSATEDNLKALGAAAASSGNVAMFHAVGLTPEADTLEAACQGNVPASTTRITASDMRSARDDLSARTPGPITTVSLGTPHYSVDEIGKLVQALDGRAVHSGVAFYVSTSRAILHEAQLRGWVTTLESAGVTMVVDTCTYITPIVENTAGHAMTDSAKWAYYAPGNIGVTAVFGGLSECVESAIAGHLIRDSELWS